MTVDLPVCGSASTVRLRMDTVHTAIAEPVRRLEVFTGDLGLSPQQLFGWRRQLREAAGGHSEADEVQFVPAAVAAVVPTPSAHRCEAAPNIAPQNQSQSVGYDADPARTQHRFT